MQRRTGGLWVAAGLLAMTSSSCSSGPLDPERAFDVTVSIEPTSFRVGPRAAEIRVVATNNSGRALSYTSDSCRLAARIENGDGVQVFETFECLSTLVTTVVEPGESVEDSYRFDGLALASGVESGDSLPPGTYSLWGGVTTLMQSEAGPVYFTIEN